MPTDPEGRPAREPADVSRPSRRRLLRGGVALASGAALGGIAALARDEAPTKFGGRLHGADARVGHLLRQGSLLPASHSEKVDTVIVGGGVAGLSAAWWLERAGHHDFVLLELEAQVGGNSASGRNEVSAYPWGAHYVPLPGPEAIYVRQLFEELGVIRGYEGGLPLYDEYFLCADPQERLYLQGRWQDGLLPRAGVAADETRQYELFFAYVEGLKNARGSDGKRPFVIPLDLGSRDEQFTRLDRVSMADFMTSQGWTSPHLHWYVDYCCRDDYGQGHDRVSAWAGLHYFAARGGAAANADSHSVLTWPEGNGWLVARLEERVRPRIRKKSLAFRVAAAETAPAVVEYYDVERERTVALLARQVIYAGPRYTASRVVSNAWGPVVKANVSFAPWIVANVTLARPPAGRGRALSWDNVSYYSASLGYVVANHQDVRREKRRTVISYYLPLSDGDPAEARRRAAEKSHDDWSREIVADLERMHPGLSNDVEAIDVWLWGHGMVSPGVGYLWGPERERMLESLGPVHFAHSDMSGVSLFEEAQYRGVLAAQKVMQS